MNRNDFPMLMQDIVYFDNGATTLKPKCVIDGICDYYCPLRDTGPAHDADAGKLRNMG